MFVLHSLYEADALRVISSEPKPENTPLYPLIWQAHKTTTKGSNNPTIMGLTLRATKVI